MRLCRLLIVACCLMAAACAPPRSPYFDTVTILTAGDVTNGVPAFKLRTVVLRGNFGLLWCGTNPVAVTSNRFITSTGLPAKREDLIAAGWITFFEADRTFDVESMDRGEFERAMAQKRPAPGRIDAIRISGSFARLVSRGQGVETNVSGVLCGFYVPPYLAGLRGSTGFRWWFEDPRTQGVLLVSDFALASGRIELDECDDLQVRLPPTLP